MIAFADLTEKDFFIIPNEEKIRLRRKEGDQGVAYDTVTGSECTGEGIRWVPSAKKNHMTCDRSLMVHKINSDWVPGQS